MKCRKLADAWRLSFLLGSPFDLDNYTALDVLLLVLTCLKGKGLIYNPFIRFFEDFLEVDGGFPEVILLIEVTGLRDG
jgi:hypothetical protein